MWSCIFNIWCSFFCTIRELTALFHFLTAGASIFPPFQFYDSSFWRTLFRINISDGSSNFSNWALSERQWIVNQKFSSWKSFTPFCDDFTTLLVKAIKQLSNYQVKSKLKIHIFCSFVWFLFFCYCRSVSAKPTVIKKEKDILWLPEK